MSNKETSEFLRIRAQLENEWVSLRAMQASCQDFLKAKAERVPLTDEQIRTLMLESGFTIKDGLTDLKPYCYAAARAIEAAHGITG